MIWERGCWGEHDLGKRNNSLSFGVKRKFTWKEGNHRGLGVGGMSHYDSGNNYYLTRLISFGMGNILWERWLCVCVRACVCACVRACVRARNAHSLNAFL